MKLFVPEVSSREALDIVSWDSIVHLAPEQWIAAGSYRLIQRKSSSKYWGGGGGGRTNFGRTTATL